MNIKQIAHAAAVVGAAMLTVATAQAAALRIDAVVTPKEQIRLDFADGSKHFVSMVRREGKVTGVGLLAGTSVVEYGRHDIVPGMGGDPSGYLVFTLAEGDIAHVKWLVRAVYVSGADGKPMLLDNGSWEVVGGTGRFKGLQVAGSLRIGSAGGADRKFTLDGEMVPGSDEAKK